MFGRVPMCPPMFGDPFGPDAFGMMQQMMRDPLVDAMLGPNMLGPNQMFAPPPPTRPRQRATTVIEEVDDDDQGQDGTEPIVEEPDDEPQAHHQYRSSHRSQPHEELSMLQEPFGAFGGLLGGGLLGGGLLGGGLLGSGLLGGGMMGTGMAMGGGGGTTFVSCSYTSVSGPNGVTYQSSSQARMGPGGVMEAKKVVKDGRSGTQSVAVARGLGEQRRTVIRSRDSSGQEQRQDILQHVAPEQTAQFDQRWAQAAERSLPGWASGSGGQQHPQLGGWQQQQQQQPLALPQGSGGYSRSHSSRSSSSRSSHAQQAAYAQAQPQQAQPRYSSHGTSMQQQYASFQQQGQQYAGAQSNGMQQGSGQQYRLSSQQLGNQRHF